MAGAPFQNQEPHCKAVAMYFLIERHIHIVVHVLDLEACGNLVEPVQVRIICPVEPLQALHGHRDLHEGREVSDVEILDTADLSLGKNDLSSGELSLQVFQGLLVLPCLK